MVRNYAKVTIRNFLRHKGISFINLTGLAIGMTCCILVALWIKSELSYDRYHSNAKRIVRLVKGLVSEDGSSRWYNPACPFPLAGALQNELPEAKLVRFHRLFGHIPLVSYDDKRFYEERFFFTDSTVLEIFSFPLLAGDSSTALSQPWSVLITEDMAGKYFGSEDPLGKVLTLEDSLDYTVTGVLQNIPRQSHFRFDFLATIANMEQVFGVVETPQQWLQLWYWSACPTYVLLPPDYDADHLNQRLADFVDGHFPENLRARSSLTFQPLLDIHLYSHLDEEIEPTGDAARLYIFIVIAGFTLLIAYINYINLSTARAGLRAKEVGLRKVCGASRGRLVRQFLFEMAFYSLASFILALILAELSTPVASRILGTKLDINVTQNWPILLLLCVMTTSVGMVAAAMPALQLSKYSLAEVIGGRLWQQPGKAFLRRLLVVLQLGLSVVFMVAAFSIYRQVDYMRNRDLGFAGEQVIQLPIKGTGLWGHYEAFKNEVLQHPAIHSVCIASGSPAGEVTVVPYDLEGRTERLDLPTFSVDYDFLQTLKIPLVAGRNFSKAFPTDVYSTENGGAYILNQTAVRTLGLQEPLGTKLRFRGLDNWGEVIGVVPDFHYESLHKEIGPLALGIAPVFYDRIMIRYEGTGFAEALDHIENVWNSVVPGRPFGYELLTNDLDQLYRAEYGFGAVVLVLAVLAIFIACLGLFGMASFMAQRRTKEIGIRKVFGATVTSVTCIQIREYIILVGIGSIIAWPVAYYLVSRWLENFAYRTEVSPWIFFVSTVGALSLTVVTVIWQSVRAALANPVDALRYE